VIGDGQKRERKEPTFSTEPKRETVPKPVPVDSQKRVNKTETVPSNKPKTVLKKHKGSTHKTRTKIRTAILNGTEINYKLLSEKCGAGKTQVSNVIKELAADGHITKNGKRWELRRRNSA
jgi:hypothetical protein